jgi:acetyl-CoA carboxylase carboxyl transferase subunit beta
VAAAVSLHDRKRLAFLSVLTDPTFGGVTASFASLGDVILAEAGAQIGFVGPRVIEQMTGAAPPEDSHHAETLFRAGLIDLVVSRRELPAVIAALVGHLRRKKAKWRASEPLPDAPARSGHSAWEKVGLARHAGRPTSRNYIARLTSNFLELHGDRWGGDDPAVVGGLAELNGQTVMIVGQERGGTPEEKKASHDGMAFAEGYRKSLRLMQLAAKFRIPVVTLIDCPGAQMSCESEHRGIAHALARNLAGMANLPTPIISVVIGEGGSGGALALGVADQVLMLEHAIYSVISPEGAAAILFRDSKKAEAISEALRLTAHDLRGLGVIDTIIPESEGGAHIDPALTAGILKSYLVVALADVSDMSARLLLSNRYKKHRRMGSVEKQGGNLIANEMPSKHGLVYFRPLRAPKNHREAEVLAPGAARRQAQPGGH